MFISNVQMYTPNVSYVGRNVPKASVYECVSQTCMIQIFGSTTTSCQPQIRFLFQVSLTHFGNLFVIRIKVYDSNNFKTQILLFPRLLLGYHTLLSPTIHYERKEMPQKLIQLANELQTSCRRTRECFYFLFSYLHRCVCVF